MASVAQAQAPAPPPAAALGAPKAYPIISRNEVEALIADGHNIIIVNQHVLKVDAWLKYHPGGDKAILHMVGKDATNEAEVYVATTRASSSTWGLLLTDALAASTPTRPSS